MALSSSSSTMAVHTEESSSSSSSKPTTTNSTYFPDFDKIHDTSWGDVDLEGILGECNLKDDDIAQSPRRLRSSKTLRRQTSRRKNYLRSTSGTTLGTTANSHTSTTTTTSISTSTSTSKSEELSLNDDDHHTPHFASPQCDRKKQAPSASVSSSSSSKVLGIEPTTTTRQSRERARSPGSLRQRKRWDMSPVSRSPSPAKDKSSRKNNSSKTGLSSFFQKRNKPQQSPESPTERTIPSPPSSPEGGAAAVSDQKPSSLSYLRSSGAFRRALNTKRLVPGSV